MRSVVVLQINTHKLLIGRFAEKFRGSSFAACWRDCSEKLQDGGSGRKSRILIADLPMRAIMMEREG